MENILDHINSEKYKDFLNKNRYNDLTFDNKKILFCDNTATGFPLKIIEKYMEKYIYKYYTNTHSNNILGKHMAKLIEITKNKISKYINLNCSNDKIIFSGFGTSSAINHLTHIIKPILPEAIIFLTKYEHYSNFLPWYHYAKMINFIKLDDKELIDLDKLEKDLIYFKSKYPNSKLIISITHCSNVLGIIFNIEKVSMICHKYEGYIFIDAATSAPYIPLNFHHDDSNGMYLDALTLSMHKFPGGQMCPGILVINKKIMINNITYTPSGGTLSYFSENIGPKYYDDIEKRENGGTPNILGIIKAGLVFDIKEHFIKDIFTHELKLTKCFHKLLTQLHKKHYNFKLLNPNNNLYRLPIFSFQIDPYHYNLIVAILSDYFGILTRGGVHCTSILAKDLVKANVEKMDDLIEHNYPLPPDYGWVRLTLSCHHTINDLEYIYKSIDYICDNMDKYVNKYKYDENKNIFLRKK